MRIIAGLWKGRTLHVPHNATFRPTTDRVKESVFNILAGRINWQHASVCDLFAGSGSLGIEAFSRGAASVCFVEQYHASLSVLERNISELAAGERLRIVRMNVERFLARIEERFDLILADPPYGYQEIDQLTESLAHILADDGIAVVEHDGRKTVAETSRLRISEHRTYGRTAVTFLEPKHGDAQ